MRRCGALVDLTAATTEDLTAYRGAHGLPRCPPPTAVPASGKSKTPRRRPNSAASPRSSISPRRSAGWTRTRSPAGPQQPQHPHLPDTAPTLSALPYGRNAQLTGLRREERAFLVDADPVPETMGSESIQVFDRLGKKQVVRSVYITAQVAHAGSQRIPLVRFHNKDRAQRSGFLTTVPSIHSRCSRHRG